MLNKILKMIIMKIKPIFNQINLFNEHKICCTKYDHHKIIHDINVHKNPKCIKTTHRNSYTRLHNTKEEVIIHHLKFNDLNSH